MALVIINSYNYIFFIIVMINSSITTMAMEELIITMTKVLLPSFSHIFSSLPFTTNTHSADLSRPFSLFSSRTLHVRPSANGVGGGAGGPRLALSVSGDILLRVLLPHARASDGRLVEVRSGGAIGGTKDRMIALMKSLLALS